MWLLPLADVLVVAAVVVTDVAAGSSDVDATSALLAILALRLGVTAICADEGREEARLC